MPTYDYVCDACEHAFEHWQTMSSPVKRTCPECKKRKLRRLIGSGAGVIFKGSGFYETDYKRKGRRKDAPGPKDGSASDSAASDRAASSEGASDTAANASQKSSDKSSAKPAEKPSATNGRTERNRKDRKKKSG